MEQHLCYCWNKVMTKTRNKLVDWKAFVNTIGIKVPIWNINFLFIHMGMNQIAKVDCNAFLAKSESRNLSLLHHLWGDSTLVPQIANVRGWSKHRFTLRLWSVCIRWNQSGFHQFSQSPALSDIIFINEFNLFIPTADFLF